MSIANRTLGAFWILIGLLIGAMAFLYMAMFARISTWFADFLGPNTPIINSLTNQFGPGFLNYWGLGLALFLILLGMRLLVLSPAARPVAMAFHLLAGLFLLVITVGLFVWVNQLSGAVAAAIQPASNTVFYVGLLLSLLLIGIGFSLGTKQAWDAFTVGGAARIVSEPADTQEGPTTRYARLVNLTDGTEHRLPRDGGQITIGSEDGRTIVLTDPTVSRYHAFIEIHDNEYRLTDNNSSNGTYVNGKQLIALGHTLQANDEIKMGNVRMLFES